MDVIPVKNGDFPHLTLCVCLPKKLLFVSQATDRQKPGFENQHLVINMRMIKQWLLAGDVSHIHVMYWDIMGLHAD